MQLTAVYSFYRAASMQGGRSHELNVHLSVRLSNVKETYAQIVIPDVSSFHLVFFEKKNGWWGRPLLPEILG